MSCPCCAVSSASPGGVRVQPFRPEVAARLAELAPQLLAQLDAATDRMVEVLLRTEPSYRALVAHGDDDLRTSTRANLERGMRMLIGAASGAGHSSLRDAREVGRRRASQGIPLEAALRAYRLGGQVTWEALLAASRTGDGAHDTLLLEVAGSVWRTNDVECAAVAEGYREEQHRLAGVDDATRQQILDGLLDGRGGDPGFVRNASELLALPLDGRLIAAVPPRASVGRRGLAAPGPPCSSGECDRCGGRARGRRSVSSPSAPWGSPTSCRGCGAPRPARSGSPPSSGGPRPPVRPTGWRRRRPARSLPATAGWSPSTSGCPRRC